MTPLQQITLIKINVSRVSQSANLRHLISRFMTALSSITYCYDRLFKVKINHFVHKIHIYQP